MTNVSDKSCTEHQTYILYSVTFFFVQIHTVRQITWKKCGRVGQATEDNIIQRMRNACWITKVTNTHSEYVIFIAFPLQQWYHERTLIFRCTYIGSIVVSTATCSIAIHLCRYLPLQLAASVV
jgi:ribulose bisphosphate carboxylase small subunit